MKLTEVRLIGGMGMILSIANAKPSDMFVFKGMDGLGPTEVAVSIARSRRGKGTLQGRRPQPRELNIRVGINEIYYPGFTYSVSELRSLVYRYLNPNNADGSVVAEFWNKDGFWTSTVGYVKRVEPNHFAEDPEVIITMECLNPYLDGTTIDLTAETMADIDKAQAVFNCPGTAPTGFYLNIQFTEDTSGFTLTNVFNGQKMQINWPFLAGQQLRINTNDDERSIRMVQGSTVYNIIGALSASSSWLQLLTDDNYFSTSSQNFDWITMTYRPQYSGV